MKSLTLKAENSLFELLKEKLQNVSVNNKKINFQKGYLKEESLRESIDSELTTNNYPLLLLRRGKFKQTLNGGITEKNKSLL